jgi:glyoxylase-like metal-dependent hydrolase (beta-lactamase superfamily II)
MNKGGFTARLIKTNIWQISDGRGCDSYLLPGKDEAVMIDSGQPLENIRVFAETLAEKPVRRVINTHSHFDHTGGNGYFEIVYGTRGIARSAKNTMGEVPDLYPLDYRYTLIGGGDIVDIGGRPLKILELSCHNPGDIAVLDLEGRALFCGDEVDSGQVLLLPGYAEKPGQIHAAPASTVETCMRTMEKLISLKPEFDLLCPAHNGSPVDSVYLEWFRLLCLGILDGSIKGSSDCRSPTYYPGITHYPRPDAGYLRVSYRGASLVYQSRLLRDADYEIAGGLPPATPLHLISAYSCQESPAEQGF